jgi:hypothetical protein
MADAKTGGKGNKKKGRSAKHPSHVRYTTSKTRLRNKIKRVLQSSGYEAANDYSIKYGVPMPKKAMKE